MSEVTAETFVPIQKFILAGLQQQIKREFDYPDLLISLQETPVNTFEYVRPSTRWKSVYMTLIPEALSIGTSKEGKSLAGSIRAHALANRGRKSLTSPNSEGETARLALSIKEVPCSFRFRFVFSTTDLDDLFQFFTTWAFAQQYNRLDFNLMYLGQLYTISPELSTDLDIPKKPDSRSENAGNLKWEGQIQMGSYLVNDDVRDTYIAQTIREADLRREVENTNTGGTSREYVSVPTIPAVPTLLGTAGDELARLTIIAPSDNGSPIIRYIVQWKSGTEGYESSRQLLTPLLIPTITGLTRGVEYTFRVRAENALGFSEWSDEGAVTPV